MRFELIGKHRGVLEDVDVQSQKMGQTDIKPAVCLHFKVSLPNSCLAMYDKAALLFLYTKNGAGAKQQVLDGVPVVSEYSQLTDAATLLGALTWDHEQTGCTLVIHRGISQDPKIVLREGTVNKYKTVLHEGGTVDNYFRFYTVDLDAETLGELCVLKSHDIELELELPELISTKQASITDAADKKPKGNAKGLQSPEEAFAASAAVTH